MSYGSNCNFFKVMSLYMCFLYSFVDWGSMERLQKTLGLNKIQTKRLFNSNAQNGTVEV